MLLTWVVKELGKKYDVRRDICPAFYHREHDFADDLAVFEAHLLLQLLALRLGLWWDTVLELL